MKIVSIKISVQTLEFGDLRTLSLVQLMFSELVNFQFYQT